MCMEYALARMQKQSAHTHTILKTFLPNTKTKAKTMKTHTKLGTLIKDAFGTKLAPLIKDCNLNWGGA